MICPRCFREMRQVVTVWNECEEFREHDQLQWFCPCCGMYVHLSVGTTFEE